MQSLAVGAQDEAAPMRLGLLLSRVVFLLLEAAPGKRCQGVKG